MKPFSIQVFLMALTNVGVTLILVGALGMGAVGCALGTLISSAVWQPILLWQFGLKQLGTPLRTWLRPIFVETTLPALVASAVAILLRITFRPTSLLSIIEVCTLVVLTYTFILLRFCLNDFERNFVRRVLGRMSGRDALSSVSAG
jgi:peptidoglycan biosynthesis protein MviN/MurJ (putative lipid II flippase)